MTRASAEPSAGNATSSLAASGPSDACRSRTQISLSGEPRAMAERARLWRLMNGIWRYYDEYQTRTEREIPVVVLERE